MKGQADLGGILRSMYSDVMGEAKALLAAPDITSDQFRRVNSMYFSVLEEARREPDLYEQFRRDSEETFTRLRVKARAHAIEVVQDITSLFSSLSSYMGGHEVMPESGKVIAERKAPALLEQRQEPKALDIDEIVSKYDINPKKASKLSKLIGTYATAKDISAIAGYTTSTFYNRIKDKKVPNNGIGGYMLDETTIPIFFGEKTLTERRTVAERQPAAEGTYLSPTQIKDRLGYSNVVTVYQKLKENRHHFKQKKEGRTTLYLVTPANLSYLEMQRHRKPLTRNSPELPSIERRVKTDPANNGDILTFNGMVEFAREKLGREGEDWVVQMISEHGDTLQKAHNKFSMARLEELLKQRGQPQIS